MISLNSYTLISTLLNFCVGICWFVLDKNLFYTKSKQFLFTRSEFTYNH